ncbi:hemolysin family protein [Gemmatimonas sp.]|uniref:hemolysin family protein n=1 Tax=Gemmatimonas sp. TaxID=1962908 RepID=UPI003566428F
MSAVAWGLATGGAVVAALAAVADGALLSEPPLSAIPAERSTLAPPAPVVPRPVPSRERTHRALAFARVLGHLAAGSGIAVGLDLSGRATLSTVALLFGLGLAVVLAAETTARVVGDALGEDAEERLAWFSNGAETLFAPIVRLGNWVEAAFAEVVSDADATIERREEAAAQFREVITSEADVSRDERDLLLGVFEFGETTVEEVMVPRVDIVGIEQDTPWSEMLDRVRSAQHSRVPIFEDTIDEIVGILYVKDLLPSVLADDEPEGGWRTLLRPPVFIPPSKRIADLLREFRVAGRHIAVVADEYGGTAGLVTIEDVLEELVGEIRDEYDEEERQVENEAGLRFWVSGQLTLDDLSEALSHDFRRDDVSTVGGLVLELLGRVPRAGEALAVGPFKVIVERVVRRKIERVFLERVQPLDSTATGES